MSVEERLEKIEGMLAILVGRQTIKDFYEVEEFARLVGKSAFTCREWCRNSRIRADKKLSGRGAYARWVVPHAELLRYHKEGLLPLSRPNRTHSSMPESSCSVPNGDTAFAAVPSDAPRTHR